MLTLVWDVDDVLNRLMFDWFTAVWKPDHPDCSIDYSDIRENPPHNLLGAPKSEYLSSLDAFRLSERGRAMRPNPLALDWLWRHGPSCRHMVLTARPLESAPHVSEWVFRHFGNYVRSVAVVPPRLNPGVPEYDRTKEDYLRWFGRAQILIDDCPDAIQAAKRLGMRGLLYPQPWNTEPRSEAGAMAQLTAWVDND